MTENTKTNALLAKRHDAVDRIAEAQLAMNGKVSAQHEALLVDARAAAEDVDLLVASLLSERSRRSRAFGGVDLSRYHASVAGMSLGITSVFTLGAFVAGEVPTAIACALLAGGSLVWTALVTMRAQR